MHSSLTCGTNWNCYKDHPLNGGWWILDAETSGFDPLTDDIVAIRLAHMEAYEIHQELSFFVEPKSPLNPGVAKLTGITLEEMKTAIPANRAVKRIEMFVADAPLLMHHPDFLLPFLQIAFHRYAKSNFDFPCLSLEQLAACVLGIPKRRRLDELAALFPATLCETPKAPELAKLYRVSTALFQRLEENGMCTMNDVWPLYGGDGL